MKKILFGIAVALLVCCSTSSEPEQEQETPDPEPPEEETVVVSLDELWAADPDFSTPESVLYDSARDILYVSNINGNPSAKDGNGFISRLNTDGSIDDLGWAEGLDGPKGMGIIDESLFVADIDRVVEIDVSTGEIIDEYPIEGSTFLNDLTIDEDGTVYTSDPVTSTIYQLAGGEDSVFLENAGQPNGLYAESGEILFLANTDQTVKSVDISSGDVTELADFEGSGDGIVPVGEDDYLVTDFAGAVFYYNPEWESSELLDTRADDVNAADIEFIIDASHLLVPTFSDNRVVGYELVKTLE